MVDPDGPIARECVEGYLFSASPLELLLFRRPPSRGRIWVPISGKVEPTDRDFASALSRELEEETGLAVEAGELIDLDWQVPFRVESGETWRLHAFAVPVARSFEPRLSAEHEAAEWVTVEEAVRRLHFDDNRAAVRRLDERLQTRSTVPGDHRARHP